MLVGVLNADFLQQHAHVIVNILDLSSYFNVIFQLNCDVTILVNETTEIRKEQRLQ
jgi:hypothetical protein